MDTTVLVSKSSITTKEAPVKIKASTNLLQLPQNPQAVHPLHANLKLLVCHLDRPT